MSNLDEKLGKRTKDNVDNKGKSGGKGFLNLEGHEDVKFYKPSEGFNLIDILPYIVSTKNHPQGIAKGDPDYICDIWVHQGVGPNDDAFICLERTFHKPCPICEERESRLKAGVDWKNDDIQELLPSRKAIYNVIEEDEPDTIKIFIASYAYFERDGLLDRLEDFEEKEEQIIFSSLSNGRSVKFKAKTHKFGKRDYFKYKTFTFEDRDKPYPESILDKVFPLDAMIIIPSYEEVRNAFYVIPGNDEEDEKENKEIKNFKDGVEQITDGSGTDEKEKAYNKALENNRSKEPPDCPNGHKFGADCDEKLECESCEEKIWKECAILQTKLKRKNRISLKERR
ncbi:MAG: hypothetical protein ACFFDY_00145 [Candidatus Thorarchaeota archaeon]